MNITPYRSNALGESSDRKFGLIIKPKPPKPHQCKLPGIIVQLYYLLYFGVWIRCDSHFRCAECGKIWYKVQHSFAWGEYYANNIALEEWKKLGGSE